LQSRKTGSSDAIALITAGGAVLTGLIGAYVGINTAHQSRNPTDRQLRPDLRCP
jgi:hypothetical protein